MTELSTDLLSFYSMCELWGEGYVGNRDIIQNKVESESPSRQVFPYKPRDLKKGEYFIHEQELTEKASLTFSRCVISWLALNCATTLFRTSFTMDGNIRSSKS